MDTTIAKGIIQVLNANLNVVWSWGFNTPVATVNKHGECDGLKFKVQGFKFKGWVIVKYDRGSDLYNLSYEGNKYIEGKEGIYFDELVNVIDRDVEYTGSDYEQKVKDWLSA